MDCLIIIEFVVRVLGTEDRTTSNPVAASDNVLAFVSFPGNEIKDLFVHESQEPAQDLPKPPAQKETSAPPKPPAAKKENAPRKEAPRSDRGEPKHSESKQHTNNDKKHEPKAKHHTDNTAPAVKQDKPRQEPASAPGTGNHLLGLKVRTNNNSVASKDTSAAEIKKVEFDFQAALVNFDKVSVQEEVIKEKVVDIAPAYVKDDFFDSFVEKKSARPTYQAERALNQDTFGAASLQSNYRRYGGRGHGGGRGRGRGRGGRGNGNPESL